MQSSIIMTLWKFFGLDRESAEAAGAAETETVRKIVRALDRLEPALARYLAGFAYILGRVAYADLDISEEESRQMERIVMDVGGLPEEQAVIVVQMAKTQNLLFGATENFLVTREFNRLSDRPQKLRLLRCLFSVACANRSISTAEDGEIRLIAKELLLEHKDFMAVRSEFRDHLAVLKDPKIE